MGVNCQSSVQARWRGAGTSPCPICHHCCLYIQAKCRACSKYIIPFGGRQAVSIQNCLEFGCIRCGCRTPLHLFLWVRCYCCRLTVSYIFKGLQWEDNRTTEWGNSQKEPVRLHFSSLERYRGATGRNCE